MKRLRYISIITLLGLLASCKAYKQSLLFQIDEAQFTEVEARAQVVESSYQIKPYDELEVTVYTNKGERLVDPNNALGPDTGLLRSHPYIPLIVKAK